MVLNPSNTWSSRRKPIPKDNAAVNLKNQYTSLAQVKTELYTEELNLAKSRNRREQELYQLQKENLQLEIKKRVGDHSSSKKIE